MNCAKDNKGHINNLYNTTFWALQQQGGRTATEAEKELQVSQYRVRVLGSTETFISVCQGTVASDKHEILFSNFKINYNNEAEMFKKGTFLYRQPDPPMNVHGKPTNATQKASKNDPVSADFEPKLPSREKKSTKPGRGTSVIKTSVVVDHVDIIQEKFWSEKPWILSDLEP